MDTNDSRSTQIPVIDIAPAAGGVSGAIQVASEIGAACEGLGFFVIAGHGVSEPALSEMYDVCRRFFEQPDEVKHAASADPPDHYRGYMGPADRAIGPSGSPPDLLETFHACRFETGRDMAAAGYSDEWASAHQPNIWPASPPDMKRVWQNYMREMEKLAGRVMSLAAIALDLPEYWFDEKFDRAPSYQVCNYYPVQPDGPLPEQLRRSTHTDFDAITILYQDSDVGGLEVHRRDGGFTPVPIFPGTFVINLGDLLAKWTNDRWVATEHRVANPPLGTEAARISIPYFHHPNKDTVIEPLPSCVSTSRPPLYSGVLAGNWSEFRKDGYRATGRYSPVAGPA